MKYLLLIFSLVFLHFSALSQWLSNGYDIYYDQGNVGIGTNMPSDKLTIEYETFGSVGRTFVKLKNNSTDSFSSVNLKLFAGDNDFFTGIYHHSNTYTASPNYRDVGVLWNHGKGLVLNASGDGIIIFKTHTSMSTIERMRINSKGNIGINLSDPQEKLEVNGNISILNNYSLILTSPNGTKYKISVDDYGNLTTSLMTVSNLNTIGAEVNIFPNPTKDQLSIEINEQSIQKVIVEILDLSGKMLFMRHFNSNSFLISTIDFQKGTYLLRLTDENGSLIRTEKFVKQ